MLDLYYKYAYLLLTKGLCIKENQPLVINAPIESIDFIRILTKVACELKIKDIYFDWQDDELEHTLLESYAKENIANSLFWNKSIHDIYAKKNAAFLFLIASSGNIMASIPSEKMKIANAIRLETKKLYRNLQSNNQIKWCIASVATEKWGNLVFPNDENAKDKLWQTIFDICLVNEENPCLSWQEKMLHNKELCDKLTALNIKSLNYQNSLGTNLNIELPYKAIWCGGDSYILGDKPIVNIPTEEVFTTPNKFKTSGIVYCSKPLIHEGITIDGIVLEFASGKVVKYYAKINQEELKNIIEFDKESSMLGEVALVDYNSKISKTNLLFYETLFDENAACHIALGRGFKECLDNGHNLTEAKLENIGYNKSKNHVDIMIGTKDLQIIATTYDNKKITIFKDGSFNI